MVELTPECRMLEAVVCSMQAELGALVLCAMQPNDTIRLSAPALPLESRSFPDTGELLARGMVTGFRAGGAMVSAAVLMALGMPNTAEGTVGVHVHANSGVGLEEGDIGEVFLLQQSGYRLRSEGRISVVRADNFIPQSDASLPQVQHKTSRGVTVLAAFTVTPSHIGRPVTVFDGPLSEFHAVEHGGVATGSYDSYEFTY